jgi:methionine synthase II (cobalamin-independent)
VRRQRDVELDVVSDGEFRRWMCMNSYYDAVSGVRTGKSSSPVAASRTLTALGK